MPRSQFTLGRLMIGVTVLCATLGLMAKFPDSAFDAVWGVVLRGPAIAIAVWAMVVSHNRGRTLKILAVGFAAGLVLMPLEIFFFEGGPPGFWQSFSFNIFHYTLPATLAMGVAAAVDSWLESKRRRPPNEG